MLILGKRYLEIYPKNNPHINSEIRIPPYAPWFMLNIPLFGGAERSEALLRSLWHWGGAKRSLNYSVLISLSPFKHKSYNEKCSLAFRFIWFAASPLCQRSEAELVSLPRLQSRLAGKHKWALPQAPAKLAEPAGWELVIFKQILLLSWRLMSSDLR